MGFASDTTNKYTDLLASPLPNRFHRETPSELPGVRAQLFDPVGSTIFTGQYTLN